MKGIDRGKFRRSQGILAEMERRGLVAFLDGADFGGTSVVVRPIPLRHLAALWDLVEACTVAKPAGECTMMEVSERQKADIRAAFNTLVERYVDGARKRPGREEYAQLNDPGLFVWDPRSKSWSAMRKFAEPAFIRKKANERYTANSALNNALELAVAHGRLHRPNPDDGLELPASKGWLDWDAAWSGPFSPAGLQGQRGRAAHLILSTALSVFGPDCPDPIEAMRDQTDVFLELLDTQMRGGACSGVTASTIRKIIRRAHAAGLLCPTIDPNLRQRDAEVTLSDKLDVGLQKLVRLVIGHSWKQDIAEAQTIGDWERRKEVRGRGRIALFDEEDDFSFSYVLDYFTARGSDRDRAGVSPFGLFPDPEKKSRSVDKKALWRRPASVEGNLVRIAAFARVVGHYRSQVCPDPGSVRLEDLLTVENVLLLQNAEKDGLYNARSCRDIARTVGIIASPCLEYRAWEKERPELMTQFREVANAAYGEGYSRSKRDRQKSLYDQFGESHGSKKKSRNTPADEIEAAWTAESGDEYSYTSARRVEHTVEKYLFALLGLKSWEEMTLELAQRLKRETLRLIQGLALWRELGVVPFRCRTIEMLGLSDRVLAHERGVPRIRYRVDAEKLKSGEKGGDTHRDMDVLVPREHDDRLINAYITFVRPLLLQQTPVLQNGQWMGEWRECPELRDTGELWVSDTAHGCVSSSRAGNGMPNARLREVLRIACTEMGYVYDNLSPYATTHCFRHMLGTFYVLELKEPKQAATLLHHVDTTMVLRTYSAEDLRVDAGEALRRSREMLRDRATPEQDVDNLTVADRIAHHEAEVAKLKAQAGEKVA